MILQAVMEWEIYCGTNKYKINVLSFFLKKMSLGFLVFLHIVYPLLLSSFSLFLLLFFLLLSFSSSPSLLSTLPYLLPSSPFSSFPLISFFLPVSNGGSFKLVTKHCLLDHLVQKEMREKERSSFSPFLLSSLQIQFLKCCCRRQRITILV